MNTTRIGILLIALLIIGGVIYYLESGKASRAGERADETDLVAVAAQKTPASDERISRKRTQFDAGHDISSPNAFINTATTSIADLAGEQVVLVDFWTYSCINCQRTIPYLNSWHEKYADKGLTIIGVHTPEFAFEKKYANVRRAVEKFGIAYPVVLDNDYSTWNTYRNQYWPRKYIIGIDGFIRYDHIGEGAYEETEDVIVELLNERSEVLGTEPVTKTDAGPREVDAVDFSQIGTPETYLGSRRIEHIANVPSRDCFGRECEYTAPETLKRSTFALDGTWTIEPEFAALSGTSGSITLTFYASKVNLVAGGGGEQIRADIYLDGERISENAAGADVLNGSVVFGEHALYNLVDLQGEYGEHTIEIRITEPGVEAFAFTFG